MYFATLCWITGVSAAHSLALPSLGFCEPRTSCHGPIAMMSSASTSTTVSCSHERYPTARHDHVHDGTRWIGCRPKYLLPVKVLSRLFRPLMLEMLVAAHDAGRLQFFGDHT